MDSTKVIEEKVPKQLDSSSIYIMIFVDVIKKGYNGQSKSYI
jgi:hypothetical protein